MAQFLVLGALLAMIGLAFDCALAATVGHVGGRAARSERFACWQRRVTGTVLIGLGLRLAFEERR